MSGSENLDEGRCSGGDYVRAYTKLFRHKDNITNITSVHQTDSARSQLQVQINQAYHDALMQAGKNLPCPVIAPEEQRRNEQTVKLSSSASVICNHFSHVVSS